MKKFFFILLCFIFPLISLISCNNNKDYAPITYDVSLDLSISSKFSQKQLENAIDCIKDNFNYYLPDSKLIKIYYDEEESNASIEIYLKKADKSHLKKENIIFLTLEYETGSSKESLTPYTIQYNHTAILIKNKKDIWEVDVL